MWVNVRSISWPDQGDRNVFQRNMLLHATAGTLAIVTAAAAGVQLVPSLVTTLVPLAVGMVLIGLLWSHARAQGAARRAEIVNSFAGLAIIHDGFVISVDREPLMGEFATRRDAARAAIDSGGWGVIVKAYDRYYLLSGHRSRALGATPVAFRTRAVTDIVPSLRSDDAISA